MDELKKILAKKVDERTAAELQYLELHKQELSTDQLQQLQDEKSTVVKLENAEKKELDGIFETKDLGDGEVQAIVASDSVDRHGEIIDIAGLSVKKYMDNPVVQWAHDYDKPPIAQATKVWKSGGKLMAKMKFALEENPFAKQVYDLIKGGFLNAVSIGFIPLEMDGNTFTKSEMVEFSVVPVPANSEALITARKLGLDTSILKSYNVVMYKLEEILAKAVADLTIGEIKFLKENVEKLTQAQAKKYASVLKEETQETEEEKVAREAKEKEEADKVAADKAEAEKVAAGQGETAEALKKLQAEVEALKSADPIAFRNFSIQAGKKGDVSKEMKFLLYARGVKSGNFSEYLQVVGKDAMNTTDDGVVLPPAEFVTEITRLEESFGVGRRFATVRRSASGNGIKFLLGDDDVSIYDTAESGVKKSTKLSYDSQTLLWRKFAAILPITDELNEDSAIDLWTDATNRFARAYARQEDQLIFTESDDTGPKNKGITTVAGTNLVEIANLAALNFEKLVDMIFGVPSASGDNGRFFLNRTFLGEVMKMKDQNDRPLWLPGVASGAPATILNRPYELTEVLNKVEDADPGEAIMVYGDLKFVTLGERNTLSVKMFDTGIVGDPDEEDQDTNTINLMTQDAQAMRVVKRMNAIVRFPAAFSVLKLESGS
jgi:HK97 family phage major capsid protein/HK97 family phage prohead protease